MRHPESMFYVDSRELSVIQATTEDVIQSVVSKVIQALHPYLERHPSFAEHTEKRRVGDRIKLDHYWPHMPSNVRNNVDICHQRAKR